MVLAAARRFVMLLTASPRLVVLLRSARLVMLLTAGTAVMVLLTAAGTALVVLLTAAGSPLMMLLLRGTPLVLYAATRLMLAAARVVVRAALLAGPLAGQPRVTSLINGAGRKVREAVRAHVAAAQRVIEVEVTAAVQWVIEARVTAVQRVAERIAETRRVTATVTAQRIAEVARVLVALNRRSGLIRELVHHRSLSSGRRENPTTGVGTATASPNRPNPPVACINMVCRVPELRQARRCSRWGPPHCPMGQIRPHPERSKGGATL
jgi:FlaA1/EpsC-like NDP-sugar epimerase